MSIIQEIPQKIHTKPNRLGAWLDTILLVLLTAFIFSGINLVPFHGDESAYIWISEDYDKIVKERNLKRILFSPEGSTKQNIRLSTGSILSFSIGFARDITNNDDPIRKWLWGSTWEENIKLGNMPNSQLLLLARTCSVLMGALSIVLFFMTARQFLPSRLAAWTAALALATHGDILVNFRRAMQEGPKFLFLVLTLYVAFHVLKDLQSMKIRRYQYVLLGFASGLTLATKQDTAPMLIAIYLALVLIPILEKKGCSNNSDKYSLSWCGNQSRIRMLSRFYARLLGLVEKRVCVNLLCNHTFPVAGMEDQPIGKTIGTDRMYTRHWDDHRVPNFVEQISSPADQYDQNA